MEKKKYRVYRDSDLTHYYVEGPDKNANLAQIADLVEFMYRSIYGDLSKAQIYQTEFVLPHEAKIVFIGSVPLALLPLSQKEIALLITLIGQK